MPPSDALIQSYLYPVSNHILPPDNQTCPTSQKNYIQIPAAADRNFPDRVLAPNPDSTSQHIFDRRCIEQHLQGGDSHCPICNEAWLTTTHKNEDKDLPQFESKIPNAANAQTTDLRDPQIDTSTSSQPIQITVPLPIHLRINTFPAAAASREETAQVQEDRVQSYLGCVRLVRNASLPSDSRNCQICYEPYDVIEDVACERSGRPDYPVRVDSGCLWSRCRHVFGRRCIEMYFRAGWRNTRCPVCREEWFGGRREADLQDYASSGVGAQTVLLERAREPTRDRWGVESIYEAPEAVLMYDAPETIPDTVAGGQEHVLIPEGYDHEPILSIVGRIH